MTTTHSLFKEFDEALKTMITSTANNNPAPKEALITNNSYDYQRKKWFADITVNNAGLKGVKALGYPRIGAEAILIFIGGNYESPYLLCNPLDTVDYDEPVEYLNLLPNGTFQQYTDDKFTYWTGGKQTNEKSWYKDTTAYLEPQSSITSDIINIEELYNPLDEELTIIMLYYLWNGGTLEVTITDTDTNEAITLAPENLNNQKEILPSTDEEWRYNRTVFYLREHKNVKITFKNTSNEKVYLDGIRLWVQDFEEWYPSQKD